MEPNGRPCKQEPNGIDGYLCFTTATTQVYREGAGSQAPKTIAISTRMHSWTFFDFPNLFPTLKYHPGILIGRIGTELE